MHENICKIIIIMVIFIPVLNVKQLFQIDMEYIYIIY